MKPEYTLLIIIVVAALTIIYFATRKPVPDNSKSPPVPPVDSFHAEIQKQGRQGVEARKLPGDRTLDDGDSDIEYDLTNFRPDK